MTTENENTPQFVAGADSSRPPGSALLWIHAHFETGEPVQIDVNEWIGRVDILDYLTDIKNLGDIEINIPMETWVDARIEIELDEGHYCNAKILPNVKVSHPERVQSNNQPIN